MRAPGRTLLAPALALLAAAALAGGGAAPARAQAPEPDLVAFARAFNAAWNAHDVEAVVALLRPGRHDPADSAPSLVSGAADESGAAPGTEDTYGAGPRSLAVGQAAPDWAGGDVLWAAGPPGVRAWLPRLFAAGHRVEASAYRAEGDTVTWRYRAFADPYQGVAGVEPVEGEAELVVRAGRVAAFAFASEEATVARRTRQLDAALSARTRGGGRRARRPGRVPAGRRPGAAGPLAPDPPLLLGLLGAAALAGVVGARRRHRRGAAPPPGAPRPAGGGGSGPHSGPSQVGLSPSGETGAAAPVGAQITRW